MIEESAFNSHPSGSIFVAPKTSGKDAENEDKLFVTNKF